MNNQCHLLLAQKPRRLPLSSTCSLALAWNRGLRARAGTVCATSAVRAPDTGPAGHRAPWRGQAICSPPVRLTQRVERHSVW